MCNVQVLVSFHEKADFKINQEEKEIFSLLDLNVQQPKLGTVQVSGKVDQSSVAHWGNLGAVKFHPFMPRYGESCNKNRLL